MSESNRHRDATASGLGLEDMVADTLKRNRIQHTRGYRTMAIGGLGEVITVDFYLPQVDGGIYVECRRQETSGSADQKCAYIVLKVIENKYGKPVIVVLSGAQSDRIYRFFKNRERDGLRVMNPSEFMTFCESLGSERVATPKVYDPRQGGLFD